MTHPVRSRGSQGEQGSAGTIVLARELAGEQA